MENALSSCCSLVNENVGEPKVCARLLRQCAILGQGDQNRQNTCTLLACVGQTLHHTTLAQKQKGALLSLFVTVGSLDLVFSPEDHGFLNLLKRVMQRSYTKSLVDACNNNVPDSAWRS